MLDLDIRTAQLVGASGLGERLRQRLDTYTMQKLKETLAYEIENSRFYGELLKEEPVRQTVEKLLHEDMDSGSFFEVFSHLPFTTPEDLIEREMDFLCVNPSQISRIVTLQTSGSTDRPKRIYFTEEDQNLTVDFFHYGMQLIVDESDKVLILMPSASAGSIGRLLGRGLRDMGAKAIEYGLPRFGQGQDGGSEEEIEQIITLMKEEKVTSVVAMPTHMIRLAREVNKRGLDVYSPDGLQLRSVLLSAEFVPGSTIMMLEETFGCSVYEHYGMTEMGLGCAVSCGFGKGYHIREADLYIEIIDPVSGKPAPAGEIVFTTLTRKGMPFLRYRTGDISYWIDEPCACGSALKRLGKVGQRKDGKFQFLTQLLESQE